MHPIPRGQDGDLVVRLAPIYIPGMMLKQLWPTLCLDVSIYIGSRAYAWEGEAYGGERICMHEVELQ